MPDYLDYFPQGAFEKQVKYITDFYLGGNNETKDNFIYLNEEEMDNFIESATKVIDELLKEKTFTNKKIRSAWLEKTAMLHLRS